MQNFFVKQNRQQSCEPAGTNAAGLEDEFVFRAKHQKGLCS
jgi:hypothetical protein